MADNFLPPGMEQSAIPEQVDQNILVNYAPEQIDQLVSSGQLMPSQANEIKAMQAGVASRAQNAQALDQELAAQKEINPAQYALDAQQGADTIEAAAMQGTQIAPGFQPIVQQPSPVPQAVGLPSTLATPAPSPDMQVQAVAQEQAKVAKANAERAVATSQAVKQSEIAQQVEQDKSQAKTQVSGMLEKSNSTLFKNIGDAIAIMLGAYSQGLTGNKENPGLKAVEKRIEQEAARHKMNQEQEAALRKLAVEAADLRLRQMAQRVTNSKTLMEMQKLQAEIKSMDAQAGDGQSIAALLKHPSLTPDEVRYLQTSENKVARENADLYVSMPYENNKMVRGVGTSESISNLKKYMAETGSIVPEIDRVISIVSSPAFNKLNPMNKEKVLASTITQTLVGALRIPISGPGPLTEPERAWLDSIIGDPTKIMSIPSVELQKLRGIQSAVRGRVKNAYKAYAGIDIGDGAGTSPEERTIEALMKMGNTREQAEQLVEMKKSQK